MGLLLGRSKSLTGYHLSTKVRTTTENLTKYKLLTRKKWLKERSKQRSCKRKNTNKTKADGSGPRQ